MSILNQIPTIDSLYQSPLIYHESGEIECPVCHKVYKREKSAIKHYDKQDCYKALDLFKDTPYEAYAYELYKGAIGKSRVSLAQFRKSPSYKVAVQFVIQCIIYEIPDYGEYYSYLNEIKGYQMINKIFSFGQRETLIEEYRYFRHKNKIIDSKGFYEKYKNVLLDDESFLVDSIIKAHISIYYVANIPALVDVIDQLPIGHQLRLDNYIKEGEL